MFFMNFQQLVKSVGKTAFGFSSVQSEGDK